jgi:uncharacterized protein with ParB-like and HNH nuclease domain
MESKIKTIENTPEKLVARNHFFAIPIYQRLYAWEEEQIVKLLDDLYSSFLTRQDKDYFIGNWVIYQINDRYDIIDGQQRMTTLWLMGFVLRQYYPKWEDFLFSKENKLRLDFIAREGDKIFLESLVKKGNKDINKLIDEVKLQLQGNKCDEINPVIVGALKFINEFVSSIDENERASFAEFIFKHTNFVGISLPTGTDLNKYFEVMNNRGVQLEKHEILKAFLLSKISDERRRLYADVWNACANMNVYIESFVSNKAQIANCKKDTDIDDNFIKIFQNGNLKELKEMSAILQELDKKGVKNNAEKTNQDNKNTDDKERCGSIVNFPSFLLHILRLIKDDTLIKIEDKDLINIFNKHFFEKPKDDNNKSEEEQIMIFFHKLLHYRILFDKYVVKSISKDNNFLWQIRELKQNNDGNYDRISKEENNSLEMVEAFLQVSTQQDIWLSLLLKKIGNEEIDTENLIKYLENIDYLLAKARLDNGKQRDIFEKLFKNKPIIDSETTSDWKFLDNGTSTPRYWFFKLDYLLWKDENIKLEKKNTFQFRQNRSVEHIHAQNQNNEINKWNNEVIDSFGNLALISVNSNSQNNNNSFEVKKALFKQRSEKYGYESLKLALIFENDNWTEKECKEHKEKMIDVLNNNFKKNIMRTQIEK